MCPTIVSCKYYSSIIKIVKYAYQDSEFLLSIIAC